ncbi:uncharacterized protein LOC144099044 [Amblyomma americanum]
MDASQPSTSRSTPRSPSMSDTQARHESEDGTTDSDLSPEERREITIQQRILEDLRPAEDMTVHRCEVCEKNFHLPSKLIAHYAYRHKREAATSSGKKLACPLCEAPCNSRTTMALHVGMHLGERLCTKCGAEFACAATAAAHKHFHKSGGHFMCGSCKKLFAYNSDREEHVRVEHP